MPHPHPDTPPPSFLARPILGLSADLHVVVDCLLDISHQMASLAGNRCGFPYQIFRIGLSNPASIGAVYSITQESNTGRTKYHRQRGASQCAHKVNCGGGGGRETKWARHRRLQSFALNFFYKRIEWITYSKCHKMLSTIESTSQPLWPWIGLSSSPDSVECIFHVHRAYDCSGPFWIFWVHVAWCTNCVQNIYHHGGNNEIGTIQYMAKVTGEQLLASLYQHHFSVLGFLALLNHIPLIDSKPCQYPTAAFSQQ